MGVYIPVADRPRYKKMLPKEKKEYLKNLRAERSERAKKAAAVGAASNASKKTLEKKAKIQKAKETTKSVAEMQGEINAMLAKHDIDPLDELLTAYKRRGKGALPIKEKAALMKFLMPYIHATKKSIDVQQDMKMSVSVNLQSFKDASQDALDIAATKVIEESEYDEFTEKLIEDE